MLFLSVLSRNPEHRGRQASCIGACFWTRTRRWGERRRLPWATAWSSRRASATRARARAGSPRSSKCECRLRPCPRRCAGPQRSAPRALQAPRERQATGVSARRPARALMRPRLACNALRAGPGPARPPRASAPEPAERNREPRARPLARAQRVAVAASVHAHAPRARGPGGIGAAGRGGGGAGAAARHAAGRVEAGDSEDVHPERESRRLREPGGHAGLARWRDSRHHAQQKGPLGRRWPDCGAQGVEPALPRRGSIHAQAHRHLAQL